MVLIQKASWPGELNKCSSRKHQASNDKPAISVRQFEELVAPVLGLQPVQHCQLSCQQQNQPLSVNEVVVPEMCADAMSNHPTIMYLAEEIAL